MVETLMKILKVASVVTIVPWTAMCVMYVMEIVTRIRAKKGPLPFKDTMVISHSVTLSLFLLEGIFIGIILYA